MKKLDPPTHIISISPNFIKLRMESNKAWTEARKLGGKWRWFPPAFGIFYSSADELPRILGTLRDAGYMFPTTGEEPTPASVMEGLINKGLVSSGFTAVEFLPGGEWKMKKNDNRPVVRAPPPKPGKPAA